MFPASIFFDDLVVQVENLSQLVSAKLTFDAIDKWAMVAPGNRPLGESYKDFLIIPEKYSHGWRCNFSLPDGSYRKGSVSHPFPSHALTWGKEMIDTVRVYQRNGAPRQFIDEPLVIRDWFTIVDFVISCHCKMSSKSQLLLARYLLLHFGNSGKVDFWDRFLAPTVQLGPRQLTSQLKDLSRQGIIRYIRWPNRACPTSYYLGPAWLSVKGVTLSADEVEAIEDGEMYDTDTGYLWSIPFGKQLCEGARTLQHEGDAIVRVPSEPKEPIWYSTWKEGEWTHSKKLSPDGPLEPVAKKVQYLPPEEPVETKDIDEYYKGCLLKLRYSDLGKGSWVCNISLPDDSCLTSYSSYSHVNDALNWAKEIVDISTDALIYIKQADEQQSQESLPHLFKHVDFMLEQYFPRARTKPKLLLQFLTLRFGCKGTIEPWERLLAPALGLTARQLLHQSRELVKVGLIRYSRLDRCYGMYKMHFYLGPAWLNAKEITLSLEELEAISEGEWWASYRPWWKGEEQYPGEKYGWPDFQNNQDSYLDLWREPGKLQNCNLKREGNALVRIPKNFNYPLWYSTWDDGDWAHSSKEQKEILG